MNTSPRVLVLNIGSSSVKYAVFVLNESVVLIEKGKEMCASIESERVIGAILEKFPNVDMVAHRIVHGGKTYTSATLLNDDIVTELDVFSPFVPLHQPHNLNGYRIVKKMRPDIPQYGCFDTGFHATCDALHTALPVPKVLRDAGLRRYGFHGLSYGWIARQVQVGRVVVAHLGSGASLCAMKDGKSVDTTMGMTALEGLPMATRSGSIDPGFSLYLSQHLGYSAEQIEDILYNQSGLKGLSGISNDFKTLMDSGDPHARFAIDYFIFKTAQHVAMMVVSLGGMDTLVFTGGIGENAEIIRRRICAHLTFLPPFDVQVIQTNEERMMAYQVKDMLDPHA